MFKHVHIFHIQSFFHLSSVFSTVLNFNIFKYIQLSDRVFATSTTMVSLFSSPARVAVASAAGAVCTPGTPWNGEVFAENTDQMLHRLNTYIQCISFCVNVILYIYI